MLRRAIVFVGALLLATVAYMAFVVVGMRTKSPGALRTVRRVNRAVFNPVQMKSAGQPGARASVVRHCGRTSGRTYETPVEVEPTDDGFVIALPYGMDADWVKNLLASGSATIVHEGSTYEVEGPEVKPIASEIAWFPTADQRTFRRFKVEQCVRVRNVDRADAPVGDAVARERS